MLYANKLALLNKLTPLHGIEFGFIHADEICSYGM